MRILYGIQGTGNGHLTRSIAMIESINRYDSDVEVDVLISGRQREDLAIEANEIIWREGATFVIKNGNVQLASTLLNFRPVTIIKDVARLKVDRYDLIISDYEPIVTWAAEIRRKKAIGIGHQYAFYYDIPVQGGNFFSKKVMKYFAPAGKKVGLHWHHFNQPILPPIIDIKPASESEILENKVVVYLPFEDIEELTTSLRKIKDYDFYIYHPKLQNTDQGNIHKRTTSRLRFKEDLLSSKSVICNTGFELISECLTLGIRVLTKPVGKQIEQESNAVALSKMAYAKVVNKLVIAEIRNWLKGDDFVKISYPNTQESLTQWLLSGANQPVEEIADKLWAGVRVYR